MLDLSFELGIPAHELAHRLPHREFALYEAYALKRMLPNKRFEFLMAQISFMLSSNPDKKLTDFLFEVKEETERLHDVFQFNPRVK